MQDPQSLHKYLYVHGDPVQGVDPTGLLVGGGTTTSVTVAQSISSASIGVSIYASIKAIEAAKHLAGSSQLKPLAQALDAELLEKTKLKKKKAEDESQYKYFVHGGDARPWLSGITRAAFGVIDLLIGGVREDFGRGFYTFRADATGVSRATILAQRKATTLPFLLVLKMKHTDWQTLDTVELSGADPQYISTVNGFRNQLSGYGTGLYGADVIGGPEAHQQPASSGNWVANPIGGFQYKFETPRSINPGILIRAYIIPLPSRIQLA